MSIGALGPMLALAALALAGGAHAHAAATGLLGVMDSNQDGKVSLAEYTAYLDRGFRRMDHNGDGVLEADEWPAGIKHDGPLTLAAHRQNVRAQFQRQDRDHDGRLSAAELLAPPR